MSQYAVCQTTVVTCDWIPETFQYPKYTSNIQELVAPLIQTAQTLDTPSGIDNGRDYYVEATYHIGSVIFANVQMQRDPSKWERRGALAHINVRKPEEATCQTGETTGA